MLACLLVNFLCPHDPAQDPASCFLHWTVARQCRVIWCVTMRWKPLCKSPLWVPPTIGRVSVHVSLTTPHDYSHIVEIYAWKKIHWETLGFTSCFLNTKRERYDTLIKKINGKIAFFGQGQPAHFDHLFPFVHVQRFTQGDWKTFGDPQLIQVSHLCKCHC